MTTSRLIKITRDWNDLEEALNLVQHQLNINIGDGEVEGVE